ncbi:hypothetical protein GWK47_023770 [Chionoecetes opilio]|uniref:Secreted protein n=1 Tax=Chionoecetes opilio TaxID=41210 RepID=A0A8J4XM68_CHIOP|nr:hypothetical protein GWK47_023770 [Chionoecetes opilio]
MATARSWSLPILCIFLEEWQARTEDCDRRAAARAPEQVNAQYRPACRPIPRLCVRPDSPCPRTRHHTAGTRSELLWAADDQGLEVRIPSGVRMVAKPPFLRPVPTPSDDNLPHIPVSPCADEKSRPLSFTPCDPAPF